MGASSPPTHRWSLWRVVDGLLWSPEPTVVPSQNGVNVQTYSYCHI